ncbi:MAG: twin-arginine translocase TatA/TatE family subunit [Alphaproteobacteria bacterium]
MSIGPWQIILVVLIIVLLFGRGKISEVMGDFAKGIRSFKKGLADDEVEDMTVMNSPRRLDTEKDPVDSEK